MRFQGMGLDEIPNDQNRGAPGLSKAQVERIVAITMKNGILIMGVKFKGQRYAEFLTVNEIAAKWPRKLIEYFESKMIFLDNQVQCVDGIEQTGIDDFVERKTQERLGSYGTPKEILDAVTTRGKLFIVVKWENVDEVACVPAEVAHEAFPLLLISFYASRITWT